MRSPFVRFVLPGLIFMLIAAPTNLQTKDSILAFGVITYHGDKVSGVSIKVFQHNLLINEIVTGRNIGYGFSLDFNSAYSIEIVKEGYLKETIHIDTRVPDAVLNLGDRILWEPDLKIYKIMPGFDQEEFEQVMAYYVFNEELWGFYEDPTYAKTAEPYLSGILKTLEELKSQAYLEAKRNADSLLNREEYEEAILAFNQAKTFNKTDKSIDSDIRSAKKLLKNQTNAEEAYQKAIAKGDQLMSESLYEEANGQYQKALIYKPKELYPLDQIYAIDSIRSYAWILKVNQYENFIRVADSLIGSKEYRLAEMNLQEAKKLFPEKKQVISKLKQLEELQEASQKQEMEFTHTQKEGSPGTNELSEATGMDEPAPAPVKVPVDQPPVAESHKELSHTQSSAVESPEPKDKIPDTPEDILEIPSITPEKLSYEELKEKDVDESLKVLKTDLEVRKAIGDKEGTSMLLEEMGQVYQNEFRHREALESFRLSLEIKRELGDKSGEVEALNNIASVMYDSGSYYEAIENFEQSLELSDEMDDKQKSSEILANLATVYENTFRYDEALQQLEKSKRLKEETGDKEGISDVHKNMGTLYYEKNQFDKAIVELETSISIDKELNNNDDVASGLNSLGAAFYKLQKYDLAEERYEEALQISEETDNLREKSITLNNLGNINYSQKNYLRAIEYYQQSLELKRELKFDPGIATSLFNLGNAYFKLKEYPKALEYFTSSMEIAKNASYFEVVWLNYEAFARTYAALGRYKEAYENYQNYTSSKFESIDDDMQLVEMREQYESSKIAVKNLRRELQKQSRIARYESEKNQRDLDIIALEVENKIQQLKRQRIAIIAFVIVSILILLFSLIITKQYQLTRKAYRIVADQKRNITEGINYAARIQKAVSPPEKFVQSLLPQHFVLNKPCEVVGGDFYWVARHHEKIAVAVSDCTGHGVPGGFMSMLGTALLNEIISTEERLETHDILSQLRTRVVESLHQQASGSEALDGMDITLLLLEPEKREVQFSSAYHSLFIIRDGEFEKIKGDRVPIGFQHTIRPFTSQTFRLSSGDMIYLSTDGYTDQLGKKSMNRFMFNPFKELLMKIKDLPLDRQKEELDRALEAWKGDLPQTDDILVMGIRI